jgi:hypothetical protein
VSVLYDEMVQGGLLQEVRGSALRIWKGRTFQKRKSQGRSSEVSSPGCSWSSKERGSLHLWREASCRERRKSKVSGVGEQTT